MQVGALMAPGQQLPVSTTHRAGHCIPLGAFHSRSFSESEGQLHSWDASSGMLGDADCQSWSSAIGLAGAGGQAVGRGPNTCAWSQEVWYHGPGLSVYSVMAGQPQGRCIRNVPGPVCGQVALGASLEQQPPGEQVPSLSGARAGPEGA